MKHILFFIAAISIAATTSLTAQAQPTLKKNIKHLFLREHGFERAEIESLGKPKEVQAILLELVAECKYSQPGTKEALYIRGAVHTLGELKVKAAAESLSNILSNQKVHENIRALAAKSLGQTDADGNKQRLLTVLMNTSNYLGIRIEAAFALANTKDPQALKALEHYSRVEKDTFVRQKLETAAKELRARIRANQ